MQHFPLALSPRRVETAPTDLHLREFAQLEVQVKALQLQVAQHANPKAMRKAVAGSLAECFLFYSRLLTVESFPWPDFLAAVFTKLAEHFATSENEIIGSAILRVFQRARAHLAQVNDPSKVERLLGHLAGPLVLPASRTLTLQMLATMPSLLVHDTSLQEQILKGLSAEDRDERSAAVEAARAFLPFSTTFRKDVLTLSLEEKSTALCSLLEVAVANAVDAQQAWTRCAELFERLVDDKSAVASLRAMTALTGAYPDSLLEMHGQLLHYILDQDPRAFVRNFAILVTQQLVTNVAEDHDELEIVLEGVFSRTTRQTTLRRVNMRITLSALLLLEKWSSTNQDVGEKSKTLLTDAKDLLTTATDKRFGQVYTAIIANIARQKLSLDSATSPEQCVDELLLLLHPRAAIAAKTTWNHALKAITQLSQDYPQRLASYVAPRLIELLSVPAGSNLDPDVPKLRRTLVFKTLGAQLQPPTTSVINKELPMLLQELTAVEQTNAGRLRAVAATFFLWTQDMVLANSDNKTISEFEQELLNPEHYENHAERYEMARLAMVRGRFALAAQLLDVVAAKADSECFGGWLHALHTLCEAESRIATDQSVHLDSLHLLTRTSMYLQAARTSSFRFDLQLHFVALRLEWLQLLQNAQQLASESAFTNSAGNPLGREGQLSKQLRTLASKFGALRALLLGADPYDLDALQAHANLCVLLASAVEGFLLLRSPNSIDFPTAWGLLGDSSLWTLQLMKMMTDDVQGKLDRVAKLSPSRQPGVGARVLQQLLAALCAMPPVLPMLFFCSRLRSGHRLLSSAQFLTYAENATFTAKPRSRSQLGVPLGTDFTSVLKGVLALSRSAQTYWRERSEAVEVEVLVCTAGASVAGTEANGTQEEKLVYHRVTVTLPIAWDQVVESCAEDDSDERTMLFLPFETPVHVKAVNLAAKGSFALVAKLALVDKQGGRWPLAATGCRRGFIVY
ncbi:Integrator complex subunit 7 [Phytophthora citrophthora]|uniref:Integrator complex subunit 7 n=1 Tax=Phytophthora citrophthora TaxID=4793 RepID=A0AAD9GY12_9STRA|nr:Integrator complex subunit 7 [Phytophthora citrophthora]